MVNADKFAPGQKSLVEDADERVPEIEEQCQRYFSSRDSILSAKEEGEEALHKVGEMLHEHNLDCYILNGKKFCLEPSRETVKVKKVKQQ